jgi:hypothetical protein
MSDEELVKRLRDEHLAMTRNEAADRIEALAEGWAEATRLIDVARQQYGAEKSRAEALTAKLAKAVEALRVLMATAYADDHIGWQDALKEARAALAEIDGEKP